MLRLYWRRSETEAFGRAVARLMSAKTATEVASAFLPAVATLVGAEGAAIYGRVGNLVSSYSQHERDPAASRVPAGGSSEHRVEMRSGYMILHASPFTPFFGSDELRMLDNLGGMTDLALERCAATARERDFVSNAAHELRTPITALTGLVDVLVEHRSEMAPMDVEQALVSMSRQGTRARSLVSNLLDLAQIDRGGAAFVEVPVHLADVTRRAIEEAPPPDDRHIEVSVPDDVDVIADASRLQQVMVNLLVNAYRYGGTSVMIAAAANNGSVKLSVTDDGPGVPADVAPVIFEPFARGRDAKGLGSGLGLAIARRIVDAFGGTLSYEPAEPHGSRFDVTLRSARNAA
jgi:two-component system OmpR family sensor kinase